MNGKHAWVDATAGVAGDMLLGALLDAGADLQTVQDALDAVLPGSVRVRVEAVTRAGMRATKAHVDVLVEDPPHRTWRTIRGMLDDALLPEPVRDAATRVFARLAEAEAHVHGTLPADVHFHEVGALDSIADIVGTCAGLHALGIESITTSFIAVGSGRIPTSHGHIPIPGPAVTELSRGWPVAAVVDGEAATPTGVALLTTLAAASGPLPALFVEQVGVGAGSKDAHGYPNITRVLVGRAADSPAGVAPSEPAVVLEANIDDMDPRLWPGVLRGLLAEGADDAWLAPILMKKGRPAHTLSTLCRPAVADVLTQVIMASTTTLGVRRYSVDKVALQRLWTDVQVDGHAVGIKIGHDGHRIHNVMAEFEDVAAAAVATGRSESQMLLQTFTAMSNAGLNQDSPLDPADDRYRAHAARPVGDG